MISLFVKPARKKLEYKRLKSFTLDLWFTNIVDMEDKKQKRIKVRKKYNIPRTQRIKRM